MIYTQHLFTGACVFCLFLAGCSPLTESGTKEAVTAAISKDQQSIYQHGAVTQKLTLEDVLARALRYNLDARVADLDELIAADDVSLEMLNALPAVTAKVQRVGRNNPGGSSSFSLATGLQSLQPSISSEQYRNTQLLNVEWNLLDAGISIGRGLSASDKVLIAQERRRKVYHDVLQDAYVAFWRTAVAQSSLQIIETLLSDSSSELDKLDQEIDQGLIPLGDAQTAKSKLLDQRQQLLRTKQSLLLSDIELKTLIDYPLDMPISLDLKGHDWMSAGRVPKVNDDVNTLIKTAFVNRPEIREELLNKRISTRDITLSILETFPGINFILSANKDSNKYLAYNSWVDGIIGITQSINKIITAPVRYGRAKKIDQLADRRRQALIAAVMTQVYVSKARFDVLSEGYKENLRANDNAKSVLKRAQDYKDTGLMSQSGLLNARIESSLSDINKALAFTEVQDAYGRLINTVGIDLWDTDNAQSTIPEFARQIGQNLSNDNIFRMDVKAGGTP